MPRILTLRRLLLVLLLLPLVLVAGALLFARFGLPGLVQREAPRWVLEHTGHHLAFDTPQLELFGPHLTLHQLRLDEPDGKPLLSFAALELRLELLPLLRGEVHFDDIRLSAPHATVVVHPDGRLNWSALIERLQGNAAKPAEPAKPGKPTPVEIRSLTVTAAEIDASDERIGLHTRTTPLDLSLANLSTTGDASGQYRLSAQTSFGARVALEGQALLKNLGTSGHLQVEGLDLARLAPLIDSLAPVRIPSGVAGLSTNYQVSWQAARLQLKLDTLAGGVKDLAVTQPGNGQPAIKVGSIALDQGSFDLGPQQATLGSLKIADTSVELPRAHGAPVAVALGGLAVEQVVADLAAHHAGIARVSLRDGRLHATRLANGDIDVLEALRVVQGSSGAAVTRPAAERPAVHRKHPAPPAVRAQRVASRTVVPVAAAAQASAGAPVKAADAAAPWHFSVGEAALRGFTAGFRDETVQPHAELSIEDLSASASGISDDLKHALPVKAAFRVASGGSFHAEGRVVPATAAGDLDLRLSGLVLKPAQPYLNSFVRLHLADGSFSTGGTLHLGDASGPRFNGDFQLERLRLIENGTDNLFFGLKSFGTRRMSATPKRVSIPVLSLDGLDTQFKIAKDKSINVTRILVSKSATAPASASKTGNAATPAAGKPAAGPATSDQPAHPARPAVAGSGKAAGKGKGGAGDFVADIGQLRITGSALDFADESLALPFGTHIHDLHGVVNGLSTRSDARGQLELDGAVDDYGSAHAAGQIDLFNPTGYTDLKVTFRNVEMTRLTPYSATFAGRRINSGKLSLDLEYKIKDRQLDGENQVVMDRLTLGEKVDTPGATSLPLDLAIAILEDSDGRIDLGLPVSGSLDDPQFSYGKLVWKAIVNVIGKIVLAPFRALGSLFGGSGDKFESVAFAPGSAQLEPPEREKLEKVAAALAKRPGISMGAPGPWSEADRVALQDLQVRRAVMTRAGEAPADGGDPGPLALRSPVVQKALSDEFSARLGADTLAGLRKTAKPGADGSLPDEWWQDLVTRLRQAATVGDADLQELGRQRAATVVAGLQAAGVAATRLSTGEPAKVELQDGVVPLKFAPGAAAK